MRRTNLNGLKPEQKLAIIKVKYIQNIITSIIALGILLFALKANLKSVFVIFIITFLVADLAFLAISIYKLLTLNKGKNYTKQINISQNIYVFAFLAMWFSFLIFCTYLIIKEKSISLFIFSLIFWAVGIKLLIKQIKNIRK